MIDSNSNKHPHSVQRMRPKRSSDFSRPRVNPDDFRAKVLEDISFLQSRIAHIKRTSPSFTSPAILNTYQSMLENKENMLALIDDDLPIIERQTISLLR